MDTISDENNKHIIDESKLLLSTDYRNVDTNGEIDNNNCSCTIKNGISFSNTCNKKHTVGEQISENNYCDSHNDKISVESFIYTSLEDKVKKKDTNFKINISPYSCSEQVFSSIY